MLSRIWTNFCWAVYIFLMTFYQDLWTQWTDLFICIFSSKIITTFIGHNFTQESEQKHAQMNCKLFISKKPNYFIFLRKFTYYLWKTFSGKFYNLLKKFCTLVFWKVSEKNQIFLFLMLYSICFFLLSCRTVIKRKGWCC